MVVALSTAVMTMACQACVNNSQHMRAHYTSATQPSLEMMTAVPSALGSGVMEPRAKTPSVHVAEAVAPAYAAAMLDLSEGPVSSFVIEQTIVV